MKVTIKLNCLSYTLDFYDILFFIKALHQPSLHFNINTSSHANTRSFTHNKLYHLHTHSNYSCNFYVRTSTDCQGFGTPSHQLTYQIAPANQTYVAVTTVPSCIVKHIITSYKRRINSAESRSQTHKQRTTVHKLTDAEPKKKHT